MENYQNYQAERELSWDDQITQESNFVLLPEGEYDFMVESFERGRFNGSDKMPACNQAILNLKVFAKNGEPASMKHTLLLHTKTEWKLSEFFACIGHKQKNQPLQMNWNLVPGSRGKCKVGQKTYNGNQYNEIKKFIPAYEVNNTPKFTPGSF